MHICIPDTREVRPASGSAYLLYNVHIDGLYHCSLRYKQLHHLHQALSRRFPSGGNPEAVQLPQFPPKKLLPLTQSQVEDRRQLLEKYLQNISQDKQISQSSLFNMYLLEAQRESSSRLVDANKHVHLDIELVNGAKIRLPIVSQDSVDSILTACCRSLGLADQYHAYFCLCLCGYDVVSDKLIIKRRLSFFEAPFITLQMAIQQQEQLQSVLMSSNGPSSSTTRCCANSTTTTSDADPSNYHNHHYYQSNHDHNHLHNQYHSSNNQHQHQSLTNSTSPSSTSATNLNNNNSSSNLCRCLSCSQVPHLVSGSSPSSSSSSSSVNHPDGTPCTSCAAATGQQAASAHVNSMASRGSFVTHRILLRKSYWDPIYDTYILSDSQALNLLFIQTVYDMKHSLMFVDRATYHRLESLLAADSKLEYILLARTLEYYNYVHFEPCFSDYPRPRTKVMISIGSKELTMRVLKSPAAQPRVNGHQNHNHLIPSSSSHDQHNGSSTSQELRDQQEREVLYCTSSLAPFRGSQRQLVAKEELIEEEYSFKVPLIRCWRLTSLETLNSNGVHQQTGGRHQPAATTTLAGGKRRSLSLFNSVLGNSGNNPSTGDGGFPVSKNGRPTSQTSQGTGGSSLMATLMAHTGDSNSNLADTATGGRQSHLVGGTTLSTDSFLRFSSNSGREQTSNNHHNTATTSGQHHNCGASAPPAAGAASNAHDEHSTQLSQYELSFEYLIARDTLKWITISSDQAIFISISLQGVVDELVSKREMGAMEVTVTGSNHQTDSHHQHHHHLQNVSLAPVVSRPIAISKPNRTPRAGQRQLAESFTYLYRDGAQKNIKAKSQQQLIDRFCSGVGASAGGTSLSSSAPSSSYVLAPTTGTAHAARQRNQSEAGSQRSQVVATPSSNSSFISSTPTTRRGSILQVASLWGSSPPGRYYGHQSSSGSYAPNGGGLAPFEFGHHYHCNTRHAANGGGGGHHASKCKAPSPIINDAFEGVVGTEDDF